MAWSTRQVAELAGTTVKAVRHYHKVGLLDEPERDTNGYKRYGVPHLVRLLRIRRLSDLGVSLPQIAAMGDADEHPQEALRLLDAELAAAVDRIQRVRAELALILRESLPTDLPADLAATVGNFSEADRQMMVVYSRVAGPAGLDAYRRMLTEYEHTRADIEFDQLPADADEDTRRELTARLLPHAIDILGKHPDLRSAQDQAPGGTRRIAHTLGTAMTEIYNEAQVDILTRIGKELRQRDQK
ncbi:MerR family transcriptional regulator [Kribbella albertanoniae]|uniref:MerR family transcriptional regulator n=1 Tax=Kribbella albertanoniae TaxID=1266829 RepID=A0A4R4Q8X9_9ACTN|nr:MerR family transcriptional regulator [Kribbella albertanoniae]TDC31718.1 MerR family transcriptional regulator [Kribbella albertanoniae]